MKTETKAEIEAAHIESARWEILARQLMAEGWTGSRGKWRDPDRRARLTVNAPGNKNHLPRYQLTWTGRANEGGHTDTDSARQVLDVLVAVGLLPVPAPVTAQDVADVLTRELGREIKVRTVYDYNDKSRTSDRYGDDPFPEPRYMGPVRTGARPEWHPMDVPTIVAWRYRRPGQGTQPGKGRRA